MIDLEKYGSEVVTLKVNSGEEIISRIKACDTQTVTLEEPLSVAPGPQGVGLMPSMFTAEQGGDIVINRSSIMMAALTAEPVRVKYIEAVTGIQTSSKKVILG